MAYLGNTPQTQSFTPAIDYFNGTGATTAFTLSRPVASVAQVQVVIENVPQNPSSAYTVSGQTITFTSAPPAGTNNIYVEYTSPITQYNALSQNPSVVGDLTTSGGHYAVGSFNSGYTDGIVVDYTSGLGRVTVGASDATAFYYGGTGSRTESMRIDANGNLLLNTTTPVAGSAYLYIKGGVAKDAINVAADTTGTAYFASFRTSAGTALGGFASDSTQTNFNIAAYGASSPLTFSTNLTERMRINSSGNVGIGTSSPSNTLAVNGSGRFYGSYTEDTTNIGVHAGYINSTPRIGFFNGTAAQNWQIDNSSGQFRWFTPGTVQMAISSTGNLSFNSGYGSAATAYGCRAWVNFNGTGTVAIRASGNVTSITDNATGQYTVNFTNAMPDANYSATGGASSSNCEAVIRFYNYQTGTLAVGIVDSNAPAFTDDSAISVAVFR